ALCPPDAMLRADTPVEGSCYAIHDLGDLAATLEKAPSLPGLRLADVEMHVAVTDMTEGNDACTRDTLEHCGLRIADEISDLADGHRYIVFQARPLVLLCLRN